MRKERINEVSGNVEIDFSGKLLSIGTTVLNFNNEKQTKYRVCSIEFEDANNELQQTTAFMYESNVEKNPEVGKHYLSTAIKTDEGILLTVSALPYVDKRATDDMFGFGSNIVESKVTHSIEEKQD